MQMSNEVQKALLAVGTGLALILSIIALVVALSCGHQGGGRMFGGAPQGQVGAQGGPGQGGPSFGGRGQDGPGFGGPGQGGKRPRMMAPGGPLESQGSGTESTPNQNGE